MMLSEKIYTLRRRSGLSQEQLAEKIGVSRQAISKWEGGLSTPELEKIKALSDFFHVSIDELTREQGADNVSGDAEEKISTVDSQEQKTKTGICLCFIGAVCLILFGIFMMMQPASIEQLNESSVITLNGTGILLALFLLFMIIGIILIFKKK